MGKAQYPDQKSVRKNKDLRFLKTKHLIKYFIAKALRYYKKYYLLRFLVMFTLATLLSNINLIKSGGSDLLFFPGPICIYDNVKIHENDLTFCFEKRNNQFSNSFGLTIYYPQEYKINYYFNSTNIKKGTIYSYFALDCFLFIGLLIFFYKELHNYIEKINFKRRKGRDINK
ncbi:hypothetical protein CH370_14890 [Leptospira kmetyi]|nr:hypothetical protein CH370_14890 [Leptospira kmetyi]